MALTTQDGLVAAMAGGQGITFTKASRAATAYAWHSTFDLAGIPGAGVLGGTSTAAGVVPTSATVGCPAINAYSGTNTGYVTSMDYGCTVACRMKLYDMVFKAGAYAFNSGTVTLASQPSYSGRMPNSDYKGTEIWIEAVTAFTGNLSIAVTYTAQDGTTGRTTGTVATGVAPGVGRMIQLPLQAGDTGVQKIESVTPSVSTAGTFNALVLRRLFLEPRVRIANDGWSWGPDLTDLVQVPAAAALVLLICPDSTATGVADVGLGLANG